MDGIGGIAAHALNRPEPKEEDVDVGIPQAKVIEEGETGRLEVLGDTAEHGDQGGDDVKEGREAEEVVPRGHLLPGGDDEVDPVDDDEEVDDVSGDEHRVDLRREHHILLNVGIKEVPGAQPRERDEGEDAPGAGDEKLGKIEAEVRNHVPLLPHPVGGNEPEKEQHVIKVNLEERAHGVEEPALGGQPHSVKWVCKEKRKKKEEKTERNEIEDERNERPAPRNEVVVGETHCCQGGER